jgi:hypothetical protein
MSHATGGSANYLVSCINCADKDKRIADLKAALKRANDSIMDWENREAAICPEDVGFEEVIKALRKALAERTRERDALAEEGDLLAHAAVVVLQVHFLAEPIPIAAKLLAGNIESFRKVLTSRPDFAARLAAERKAGAVTAIVLWTAEYAHLHGDEYLRKIERGEVTV